jgi:hypothetical protein
MRAEPHGQRAACPEGGAQTSPRSHLILLPNAEHYSKHEGYAKGERPDCTRALCAPPESEPWTGLRNQQALECMDTIVATALADI